MLSVVVSWTAIPASACLLTINPTAQPDCCRAMAQECGSPGMGADASCCEVQRQDAAVTPVPLYSFEHSHKPALVTHQAGLLSLVSSGAVYRNTSEAPPPKFPPGGAFSLRI